MMCGSGRAQPAIFSMVGCEQRWMVSRLRMAVEKKALD
jgi:hypothetical protein